MATSKWFRNIMKSTLKQLKRSERSSFSCRAELKLPSMHMSITSYRRSIGDRSRSAPVFVREKAVATDPDAHLLCQCHSHLLLLSRNLHIGFGRVFPSCEASSSGERYCSSHKAPAGLDLFPLDLSNLEHLFF